MRVRKSIVRLLIAAFSACLPACAFSQPQEAVLRLPFTVGTVGPIAFVIAQDAESFQFTAVCQGSGAWRSITLDVHTATSTNTSSTAAPQTAQCTGDNAPVFSGSLFGSDSLTIGEQVDVYFDVALADGLTVKTGRTCVIGAGKTLRSAEASRGQL